MMSVRIFAMLAILASGLFAIKGLAITDEVLSRLNPVQPAWASGKSKSHEKPKPKDSAPDIIAEPETSTDQTEEAPVCKALSFAEQAGLSEQELRVVMRLSERREDLDRRETDLQTREGVVALSERQLDDRLARIETAIAKFDARIGMLDEQEEARMNIVVKTYEAMKSKSAAQIFNSLDDTVLLQVATRMKPQAMAKVLAAMDTKRATELTRRMTQQFERPDSAQALLNGETSPVEG